MRTRYYRPPWHHRFLDWVVSEYYRLWACPHGHHKMKFSGCMYCGQGGNQQPRIHL